MVLNFKYHSDSGVLQSYQNYTVAQNSNMTNTVVITSTDIAADDYRYCLEFVCYNSKNVPKSRFVSPIIDHTQDGISFVLPSSLTQYKGHVDMQLIGYSKEDNAVIFKSINKGCKAYDVEGSLNALESEISDTPNLLTELLDEVEYYRSTRDGLMAEVKQEIADIANRLMQGGDTSYRVKFRINGEIVKSVIVKEGSLLTPPEYMLPAGCEVREGWYDMSKNKLWNFSEDRVCEDVALTLNFASIGIGFSASGRIKDFGNLTGDIYLPDYYNGSPVYNVDTTVKNVASGVSLHFGYLLKNYMSVIRDNDKVKNIYFPKDSKFRNRAIGVYSDREETGAVSLIFAPRVAEPSFYIQPDCQQLDVYAISHNPSIKKIAIPSSVTGFNSNCIHNTGVETLTIPPNVVFFSVNAISNNAYLNEIYLEGDMSEIIDEYTFIDTSTATVRHPTLFVKPEHYASYIAKNLHLHYTIEVMGSDYMDGRYSKVGG